MSSRPKIDISIPIHLFFAGDSAVNLNSPRLREACKIQGINVEELVPKALGDIREMYKEDHLNREALILATQHYEERREAKIKIVLGERDRIIEEDNESKRKNPDIKINRLFTLTGKVTKRPPLPETLKERKQLREMVVRQQREIDEVLFKLQHGSAVNRNLHRERVLREQAENAHHQKYDKSPSKEIEVITGEDFRRATVGGNRDRSASKGKENQYHRSFSKPWKKARGKNGPERRKLQRLVYANEIFRFMDEEKKNKENDKKKKVNYLYMLRRQKGNYLDHEYVWREDTKTTEHKLTRTINKFYEDQLKHIQENENINPEISNPKNISVAQRARNVSRKWLKDNKEKIEKSANRNQLKPAERFLYGASKPRQPVKEFLESGFAPQREVVHSSQNVGLSCLNLYNAHDSSDEEWVNSSKMQNNIRMESVSSSWAKSKSGVQMQPEYISENNFAKEDDYHKMLQLRSDRTSSTNDMRGTLSGFMSMRSTGTLNGFNMTANSKSSKIFSSPKNSTGILKDTSQKSLKDSVDRFRSSEGWNNSKSVSFYPNNENGIDEAMRMAKLGIQISKDDEAYQRMYEEMYRERERQESLKSINSDRERKHMKQIFAVERAAAKANINELEAMKSSLSKHIGLIGSQINS